MISALMPAPETGLSSTLHVSESSTVSYLADISAPSDGTNSGIVGIIVTALIATLAVVAAGIIAWRAVGELGKSKGNELTKALMHWGVALVVVEGLLGGIWLIVAYAQGGPSQFLGG